MKKILVFVVRHGEREDEASYNSGDRTTYRKRSRDERIDPRLTVKGHQQAAAAFGKLLTALTVARVQRVVAFSSPLRRAMGTAMMLASAMQTTQAGSRPATSNGEGGDAEYSRVLFGLPSLGSRKDDEGDPTGCDGTAEGNVTIPVVVHNGLSNCTALVGRLGGHKNVVRAGLMRCAATPENEIDNPHSPLRTELVSMTERALEALNADDYTISPASLQFWKIEDAVIVPMSPPIRLSPHDQLEEEQPEESRSEAVVRSVAVDDSEQPIDQVVRVAIMGGNEACVVASHREEIRDLIEKRCKVKRECEHIPYCSIGLFEAWIEEDGSVEKEDSDPFLESKQPLQWALHQIASPEDIQPHCVSDILWNPTKVSSKSVEIFWPVIERTMLSLCEARLILDDQAAANSVVGIDSCTFTGASGQRPTASNSSNSEPASFTLILQICKGRHSWLEFLGRLRYDVAFGTVELEIANQSVPSKYSVLLRPEKQPALPCPPKTLHLEVLQ